MKCCNNAINLCRFIVSYDEDFFIHLPSTLKVSNLSQYVRLDKLCSQAVWLSNSIVTLPGISLGLVL
jgi:hypothetical protein